MAVQIETLHCKRTTLDRYWRHVHYRTKTNFYLVGLRNRQLLYFSSHSKYNRFWKKCHFSVPELEDDLQLLLLACYQKKKKIRKVVFGQCWNQNRSHLIVPQKIGNTSRNNLIYSSEKAAAGKNKIHKVTFSVMLWYTAITRTLDL